MSLDTYPGGSRNPERPGTRPAEPWQTVGGTQAYNDSAGYKQPFNAYEDWLGAPRSNVQMYHPADRETETHDLSQAYTGNIPFVSQVIIRTIREEDEFWTREVLPWLRNESSNEIKWNEIRFNDETLDARPDEGVVRLVSSERKSYSVPFKSFGKAMQMEVGFYKTAKGRQHYALSIKQIANATRETANYSVAVALLSAHVPSNPLDALMSDEASYRAMERLNLEKLLFGILHEPNGFGTLLTEGRRLLNQSGVTPDMIILPMGGLQQAQNAQLAPDALGAVTTNGIRVRESRGFVLGKGIENDDPFKAEVQIGSYFFMSDKATRDIDGRVYQPSMRDIRTWNENTNNWQRITIESAVDHCGLWKHRRNQLTDLGEKFFKPSFNGVSPTRVPPQYGYNYGHDTKDCNYWHEFLGTQYFNEWVRRCARKLRIPEEQVLANINGLAVEVSEEAPPAPVSRPSKRKAVGGVSRNVPRFMDGYPQQIEDDRKFQALWLAAEIYAAKIGEQNKGKTKTFWQSLGISSKNKQWSTLYDKISELERRLSSEIDALSKKPVKNASPTAKKAVFDVLQNPSAQENKPETFDDLANAFINQTDVHMEQIIKALKNPDGGVPMEEEGGSDDEKDDDDVPISGSLLEPGLANYNTPVDINLCRWALDHGCNPPMNFIGFIPHQTFLCGSAVIFQSQGLGYTHYGHENFMTSINTQIFVLKGSFNTRLRALVHNPRQIQLLRNVQVHRYLGGLNTSSFFDHSTETQDAYRRGETFGKSVFFCATRPTWEPKEDMLDLTGVAPWVVPDESNAPTGFWPRAHAYVEYWRWRPAMDPMQILYQNPNQGPYNTVCYKFVQENYLWNGTNGTWGDMAVNAGHLGSKFYPGCADVRSGRQPFFQQIAYDDTKAVSVYKR